MVTINSDERYDQLRKWLMTNLADTVRQLPGGLALAPNFQKLVAGRLVQDEWAYESRLNKALRFIEARGMAEEFRVF